VYGLVVYSGSGLGRAREVGAVVALQCKHITSYWR
jgi:hypothetical protein